MDHHSIQITQQDIDLAYKITDRIGRRWVEKLIVTDDDHNIETSRIVKLVLQKRNFLEANYLDDLRELDSFDRQTQGRDEIGEESSVDSNSSKEIPSAESQIRVASPSEVLVEVQQQRKEHDNDKSLSTIKQSTPYSTLLKIGQLDPCHLNSSTIDNGTAEEWHPLPAVESSPQSSSLVHIPNPCILPPDQIKGQSEHQLYGLPALQMAKTMNIREQINIIEEMGIRCQDGTIDMDSNGGERLTPNYGHTMWPYGWDLIQDQAEKNHERLHPHKLKKGSGRNIDDDGYEEMVEVIPRSLLDDGLVSTESTQVGGRNSANEQNDMDSGRNGITPVEDEPIFVGVSDGGDTQRLSATKVFEKTIMSLRIKRKRDESKRGTSNGENRISVRDLEAQNVVSKKPSAYGDRQWNIDQIKNELGEDVRNKLEQTMLHKDEETAREHCSCRGSLKMLGNIHLWEQLRSNQWKGKMDEVPCEGGEDMQSDENADKKTLKLRKSAHRKAKKQRLYPNYEAGTKGYHDSKFTSKIIWAEKGREGATPDSIHVGSDNQCMELDLADCIISLVPSHGTPVPRKMLAFRSLEISLSD